MGAARIAAAGRLLVAAVGVMLVLAVCGCASLGMNANLVPKAAPSTTGSANLAITMQVCRDARTAVAGATFNLGAQLDAIDRAAADGDQAAILTAADSIQNRLLSVAGKLSTWAGRPVRLPVRQALTGGAHALRVICSATYPGNQADIARQLAELSASLTRACG